MTRTYDTTFKGIKVRVLLDCERRKVPRYELVEYKGRELDKEYFVWEDVPYRLVRVNNIATGEQIELTDEEDGALFEEAKEYFGK